jgi:hypothetical protein
MTSPILRGASLTSGARRDQEAPDRHVASHPPVVSASDTLAVPGVVTGEVFPLKAVATGAAPSTSVTSDICEAGNRRDTKRP